jgi:hypothetical protein
MKDQRLYFIWSLPFDLSAVGGTTGAYVPAIMASLVFGARKPPLHDKAVVLEKDMTLPLHLQLHSTVFEKLIVDQLLKKMLAFCGTRKFVTMPERVHQWALPWVR